MLLLPILMPVIGGIFLFRQTNEERCNRLALGLVLATGLLALTVCLLPWRSMELLVIQGPLRLVLSNDGLARFFMILIAGIWALVTVFSFPYIHHVGGANQYQGFSVMALGILMGLSMAANFVTMYMFFEMMSLLTMPLVLHNATPSARRAGFKYLGFSVFGAGMALAGYFFLAGCMKTQSFTLGGVLHPELSMEHRPLLLVMYVLMLVGFGA